MLSHFTAFKWIVDHEVKEADKSKAETGDEFLIVADAYGYSVTTTGKQTNKDCWKATSLQYDALRDQLTGVMRDGDGIRYVCISLDRTYDDQETPTRIHCYVSPSYTLSDPQPDDGSWTAGGHPK